MTPIEDRDSTLRQTRNLKMARSAHAYVRGNTVQFYEWLGSLKSGTLPEGPAIWICGDCHVGNLGPLASAGGRIQVQIRDLDQTVIGNPAHDLVRLGLSLASAARGSDLPGVTTARMVESLMEGYEEAFQPEWDGEDVDAAPDSVRLVLRDARSRTWKHLARERIRDVTPSIPLGKRFWPLSETERHQIDTLFEDPALKRLVTTLRSRDDDAPVEVADAAYWRKGCSSLGLLRYAVLLSVGKGRNRTNCLMDIKQAVEAAAPHYPDVEMPADDGERIVAGARHLSPHLGQRIVAARIGEQSIFVRELLPQDLKLEVESLTSQEAIRTARYLAGVVGKAHARQMGAEDRRAWQADLKKNRTANLDAPSWLWNSIVTLLANHERGYLEHCRKFALAAA